MSVKVREKEKGSGVWWIIVHHDKKRFSKLIGKDKRLAKEIAKEFEDQLLRGDCGIMGPKEVHLFKEYAGKWIDRAVPATCKRSTLHDYQAILKNHILPRFGQWLLPRSPPRM